MIAIHAGLGLLQPRANATDGLDNSDHLTADLSTVTGSKDGASGDSDAAGSIKMMSLSDS